MLVLPISLLLFALLLSYHLYTRLRFKLPPGPRPWPVVGNLYDIKPVQFRCYHELARVYGPIISVWFGSTLNVIVSNTELAREVLRDHDQHLTDRPRNESTDLLSVNGADLIWADYGPHYVKVRKVCKIGLFSAKKLELLRPIREDEVTAMIQFIYKDCTSTESQGKSLTLRKYLGGVAFNIITRISFGKRFMNDEGELNEQGLGLKAVTANILKIRSLSRMVAEHVVPWLLWMFPLNKEAFVKHNERWYRLAKAIMAEHIIARHESGDTKPQYLVDALLTLKDEYDLSEDTIIGVLSDMTVAGIDTMVISVEWAMAELIRNPRAQKKAQEELDRVIGPNRILTEADFPNLPYLQALTKEALRIHPPTPLMLPHRARDRVKIGGYDIPKGTVVSVNVWALARDPAVWKDPLEFRPERFLEEDVDIKGSDFRMLPFGAGRRVCPGAQLGMNMVTSMLGHLLHHFSWSPPNGLKPEEIDMSESPGLVTYMTSPLQVVPRLRLPSHLYTRVPADM